MHIIAVLEYPADDSADLCFIDLDKLDPDNEVHAAYLEAIKLARKDGTKDEEIFSMESNLMVMYGNKEMEKAVVKPTKRKPLEVKEALTVWGEG